MWQGIDQRRFPRAKYQCTVKLTQDDSTSTSAAVTENIGLGGVCILLERGLDIFSPVELELALSDGRPPLKVKGTIVWVVRRRELKKGPCFDTGVEVSELSPEEKARLEAEIAKASRKR